MANDAPVRRLYAANVPRKRSAPRSAAQPDWHLQDWMATLKVKQADLARECGWTNSTMHGIYHGRTEYYRELVNLIASKLNIEPFELLMHPDDAMAHRRMRRAAEQMVKVPMLDELAGENELAPRTGTGG